MGERRGSGHALMVTVRRSSGAAGNVGPTSMNTLTGYMSAPHANIGHTL